MPKEIISIEPFDLSIFEVKGGKVNLTKICQYFNRRLDHWLKSQTTQCFLEAYKAITPNGGIEIIKGGSGEQGTFGTREVALKVAQWISPEFEVWCIKKLDTLLQTGKVELQPIPTEVENYLALNENERAILYFQQKQRSEELEKENQEKTERIERLMGVSKVYTTTEIAKELNLKSAIELNDWLESNKYQHRSNGTWVLYSNYSDKNYTVTKQQEFPSGKIVYYRHWTQAGRDWILSIFPKDKKKKKLTMV